jgi:hypothetical protein
MDICGDTIIAGDVALTYMTAGVSGALGDSKAELRDVGELSEDFKERWAQEYEVQWKTVRIGP